MNKSIILIPVLIADPVVGAWRKKYDDVALHGIPSHITLLFPFKDPLEISEDIEKNIQEFFSNVKSFQFSLEKINRFPNVVFLEPNSRDIFIKLTEGLVKIFPENLPYEGKYPKINPHLTIAELSDSQKIDYLEQIITCDIENKLPIKTIASEVWLMIENEGEWKVKKKFYLL